MVTPASLPEEGEEGQGGKGAAAVEGALRVMAASATSFANVPTDPSSSGGSGTPRAARMHIGRCTSLWAAWHTLPQYSTDLQAEHRRRGGPHRAPPQNAQGLPVPALARQRHGPRPEGWPPGDGELSLSVILAMLPPSTVAGGDELEYDCVRASTPAANSTGVSRRATLRVRNGRTTPAALTGSPPPTTVPAEIDGMAREISLYGSAAETIPEGARLPAATPAPPPAAPPGSPAPPAPPRVEGAKGEWSPGTGANAGPESAAPPAAAPTPPPVATPGSPTPAAPRATGIGSPSVSASAVPEGATPRSAPRTPPPVATPGSPTPAAPRATGIGSPSVDASAVPERAPAAAPTPPPVATPSSPTPAAPRATGIGSPS